MMSAFPMFKLLVRVETFNHAELKDMVEVVQAEYEDAKGDMHTCIASWLTAMGAEIK